MAICDYGYIVKKNRKVLKFNELFVDSIKTIGVNIKEEDREQLIYLGDKDFCIGIYKGIITFYKDLREIDYVEDLNCIAYKYGYDTLFRYDKEVNGIKFHFKGFDGGNRYKLRFEYKNDLYEILYGYGVDLRLEWFYGLTCRTKNKVLRWMK